MKAYYIFLIACCCCATACTKDTEHVFTRTVTPIYPVITLKGDPVVSTGIGTGAYTDPGATAFDSIANSTTTLTPTSNNVDLTQVGFYAVSYDAKNTYGYRASATRLILVTQDDPADDISGTYARTSNGQVVHVEKKGTGLFTVDNPGGVAGDDSFISPYYIGFTDATHFEGPEQDSPNGSITLSNPKIVRSGSNITLSWVVLGAAFGTSTRTFVKQ